MNILSRINKKAKDLSSVFFRKKICEEMRKRLRSKEVSIISSNCIGGILSHDLNLRFASPTVNLYFTAGDFVKFAGNIRHYIGQVPEKNESASKEKGFLVANLDDIILYAVHYHSIEELQSAWKRRSERIHWDHLFFIMTDRNNMTEKDLEEFSRLPYPKVLFSSKSYPQYDFVVYIKEFQNAGQVGQLQFYADFSGHRYYEKYFDFVEWLNHETH